MLSEHLQEHGEDHGTIAWDVYLVIPPGERWEMTPPALAAWFRQLHKEPPPGQPRVRGPQTVRGGLDELSLVATWLSRGRRGPSPATDLLAPRRQPSPSAGSRSTPKAGSGSPR